MTIKGSIEVKGKCFLGIREGSIVALNFDPAEGGRIEAEYLPASMMPGEVAVELGIRTDHSGFCTIELPIGQFHSVTPSSFLRLLFSNVDEKRTDDKSDDSAPTFNVESRPCTEAETAAVMGKADSSVR